MCTVHGNMCVSKAWPSQVHIVKTPKNVSKVEEPVHGDRCHSIHALAVEFDECWYQAHKRAMPGISRSMWLQTFAVTSNSLLMEHWQCYEVQGNEFLRQTVVDDKTWCNNFQLTGEAIGMQRKHLSSPCHYEFMSQSPAGKIMLTAFFMINELLLLVFKNSAIITKKQCYCGTLTVLCTPRRSGFAKQMRGTITLSSTCPALCITPHIVHVIWLPQGSTERPLIQGWQRHSGYGATIVPGAAQGVILKGDSSVGVSMTYLPQCPLSSFLRASVLHTEQSPTGFHWNKSYK